MRHSLIFLTLWGIAAQQLVGCSSARKCELPQQWRSLINARPSPHAQVIVRVDLTSHERIRWNGVTISNAKLLDYLRESADQFPLPFLAVRVRSQDCGGIEVLRQVDRIYHCRHGACGLDLR